MEEPQGRVLVTGATGFVGSHCIRQLWEHGYSSIRAQVRDRNSAKTEALLGCLPAGLHLEVVEASLGDCDDIWDTAVSGCAYVIHTAAPVKADEFCVDGNRYLKPAVEIESVMRHHTEGVSKIMEAAKRARVKRVVLTSSLAACTTKPLAFFPSAPGMRALAWQLARQDKTLSVVDDSTWADERLVAGYILAKTKAERVAWQIVEGAASPELSVILPSWVLGPPLNKHAVADSLWLVDNIMRQPKGGQFANVLPLLPHLFLPVCDVRDVALMHVRAMTSACAAGNRYHVPCTELSFSEISKILASTFKPLGYNVNTRRMPYLMARVLGICDILMQQISESWGDRTHFDFSKAVSELNITQTEARDAICDAVHGCISIGRYEKKP
mmetsp:Transcript_65350/g.108555  ORF Transcript_65350/g.108555 Transcript_65350/m.108555 type:complete len:384 (+) Transcript_65350:47-1198(+)|eukprot:CAMPEP_0119328458 /NCGR_PEP_ID=MMETSP1333-20130426/73385_1 /TAXON_ID=418940 /ORGANISM="Scyphosphaera apsteinii, Strain RCC1455" /LENGTH=383 /DNA_ID=CAMNT_0007337315 /DNA_START=41 /DNA_END=1192 /DNA_ORIENTATION=+